MSEWVGAIQEQLSSRGITGSVGRREQEGREETRMDRPGEKGNKHRGMKIPWQVKS